MVPGLQDDAAGAVSRQHRGRAPVRGGSHRPQVGHRDPRAVARDAEKDAGLEAVDVEGGLPPEDGHRDARGGIVCVDGERRPGTGGDDADRVAVVLGSQVKRAEPRLGGERHDVLVAAVVPRHAHHPPSVAALLEHQPVADDGEGADLNTRPFGDEDLPRLGRPRIRALPDQPAVPGAVPVVDRIEPPAVAVRARMANLDHADALAQGHDLAGSRVRIGRVEHVDARGVVGGGVREDPVPGAGGEHVDPEPPVGLAQEQLVVAGVPADPMAPQLARPLGVVGPGVVERRTVATPRERVGRDLLGVHETVEGAVEGPDAQRRDVVPVRFLEVRHERAVRADRVMRHVVVVAPGRECVEVEDDLLRAPAHGAPQVDRILPRRLFPFEVLEAAVRLGRELLALGDLRPHLALEPVRRGAEPREHRIGVGVLALEVRHHRRIVAIAHPRVRIGPRLAEHRRLDGAALGDRGQGS